MTAYPGDLAARLEVLADGVEGLTRRLAAVIRADHRTRWSGPYRDRVEDELTVHAARHRALAADLRTAAATARR